MAGETITGGRQNRTLQVDALLGPDSTTVLPLYCVQKGRWAGGKRFGGSSGVAPQRVREMAAAKAGQEAVWSEVARANDRLKAQTDSQDLAAAMDKPETARRLAELRAKVVPDLPRGCVGIVVAWRGRIVGADLLNSPELFADLRDKILDSYLSQYGWPLPVRESIRRPEPAVTAEQVRDYLRGCYRSRFRDVCPELYVLTFSSGVSVSVRGVSGSVCSGTGVGRTRHRRAANWIVRRTTLRVSLTMKKAVTSSAT